MSLGSPTTSSAPYSEPPDGALRSLLAGGDTPLVLAATEPLASIYRSVNTYPHLASAVIAGSPGAMTDAELAERARPVLDRIYHDELAAFAELFERRENQGRATSDIAQAARAATYGAVETMLMDIDGVVPGTVDETNGSVAFADPAADFGLRFGDGSEESPEEGPAPGPERSGEVIRFDPSRRR